jgi:cell division protein FtsQ
VTSRPRGPRRGLPPMSAGVAAQADKRFRRGDHRPGRRRRVIRLAVRATALLLIVAVVSIAGLWLARTVLDSSWFRVNRLVVTGTTRLSTSDVEAMLAGIRRQSILRVDFEQYRRRVLDSPWVADVTLWRHLPSTVEVRVRERTPIAIARVSQQLYLVDGEGVIIDDFGPEYAAFDLPIVSGLTATPATGGSLVDGARMALARRFIESLSGWPALRDRIGELDVSSAHDAVVTLEGDTALLHVGETRFVERLKLYLELAPSLREQMPEMEYVDLRFDDRLYVRPREGMKKQ